MSTVCLVRFSHRNRAMCDKHKFVRACVHAAIRHPYVSPCQLCLRVNYFASRDGIFLTAARLASRLHQRLGAIAVEAFPGGAAAANFQNPTSRNCCWARCACRMSRTVFLSAQPCFHGLHRPHADDLSALIRRWVRFVFMGCPR